MTGADDEGALAVSLVAGEEPDDLIATAWSYVVHYHHACRGAKDLPQEARAPRLAAGSRPSQALQRLT